VRDQLRTAARDQIGLDMGGRVADIDLGRPEAERCERVDVGHGSAGHRQGAGGQLV